MASLDEIKAKLKAGGEITKETFESIWEDEGTAEKASFVGFLATAPFTNFVSVAIGTPWLVSHIHDFMKGNRTLRQKYDDFWSDMKKLPAATKGLLEYKTQEKLDVSEGKLSRMKKKLEEELGEEWQKTERDYVM